MKKTTAEVGVQYAKKLARVRNGYGVVRLGGAIETYTAEPGRTLMHFRWYNPGYTGESFVVSATEAGPDFEALPGNRFRIGAVEGNAIVDEWPEAPSCERYAFSMYNFSYLVKRVLHAASKDEGRPILNTVHFSYNGDSDYEIIIEATDGYRLAREYTYHQTGRNEQFPLQEKVDFILPADVLAALPPTDLCDVHYMPGIVKLVTEFWECTFLIIEGHYPQVDAIIPKKPTYTVTVDGPELEAICKEVLSLKPDSNRLVFRFLGDKMQMQARAGERKWRRDIPASVTTIEDGDVNLADHAINVKFLLDAVKGMDTFTMGFTREYHPIRIDDGSRVQVIMPMNIASWEKELFTW